MALGHRAVILRNDHAVALAERAVPAFSRTPDLMAAANERHDLIERAYGNDIVAH